MLDLAIQWWTSVCDGEPITYAEEISPQNPPCDTGIIVFRSLTIENPKGMAKAIMDGRVCTPDVFVQQTIARARCLVRLNELRRLSSRSPATAVHAKASFLCLLDATRHLRESSTAIQELFRQAEIIVVFMEVLGGIRQIAVQPSESSREQWGKGCADDTTEILNTIMEWVLCTPSRLVESVQLVVKNGFLMHLGDTIPFSEDENSRCISLIRLVMSYATYPRALRAIETGVLSYIVPKIPSLETGSAQRSYLGGLASGLEPLRMLAAIQAQTSLCDNMRVSSSP